MSEQLPLEGLGVPARPASPPEVGPAEPTPFDPMPELLELGVTLCALCRVRDAELVMDAGERWAKPACFDCADRIVERELAASISPELAAQLESVLRDEPVRPRSAPVRLDELDHSKLNELRRQWIAYRDAAQ